MAVIGGVDEGALEEVPEWIDPYGLAQEGRFGGSRQRRRIHGAIPGPTAGSDDAACAPRGPEWWRGV